MKSEVIFKVANSFIKQCETKYISVQFKLKFKQIKGLNKLSQFNSNFKTKTVEKKRYFPKSRRIVIIVNS